MVAFASRRTLILESLGWRYQPDGGWDSVFQPISKTCLISNAALLAIEKRANDSTAHSDSRGDPTKSRKGEKEEEQVMGRKKAFVGGSISADPSLCEKLFDDAHWSWFDLI